jgi:hypothetical protein
VEFEDATLIRLADAGTRRAVFDELSLEHILRASLNADASAVDGPYDAAFDEVRLGVCTSHVTRVEGSWSGPAPTDRVVAHFELAGPPGGARPRADLVWRGAVIARTAGPDGAVTGVELAWPDLASLDDDIAQPPADPADLEAARRTVLLTRLRAGAAQPDAVTERVLDRMLTTAGVATVGELAQRHAGGTRATTRVLVRFGPDAGPPPTPQRIPVAVALLVRAKTGRLADLLAESAAVRDALSGELYPPAEGPASLRGGPVVAWVLPSATLDDIGWPGAEPGQPTAAARLARREAAAAWLGPAGIALVAVDPVS